MIWLIFRILFSHYLIFFYVWNLLECTATCWAKRKWTIKKWPWFRCLLWERWPWWFDFRPIQRFALANLANLHSSGFHNSFDFLLHHFLSSFWFSNQESFIEIWNRKTCWLTQEIISSFPILAWRNEKQKWTIFSLNCQTRVKPKFRAPFPSWLGVLFFCFFFFETFQFLDESAATD